MRKNANEIIFDEIIVLGTPALFTDWWTRPAFPLI